MYKEETIELCHKCKGSGKKVRSERYDYHHGYDHEWDEVCDLCGGHGRLKKIVTTDLVKLTEEDLKLRPKPPEAE